MSNTFLIFGDSPTMLEVTPFLPSFRAKFRTISLNRTKWQCEYTIGMDKTTWEIIEKEILSGKIPPDYSKWVAPQRFNNLKVPFYEAYFNDDEIDNDHDNRLYPGPNSLIPALNLAFDEGAKRIVILGCELIINTPHSTDPGRVFAPFNWAEKAEKIKNTVNEYKKHVEFLQIAAPDHLLDIPVITPEELLNNYE